MRELGTNVAEPFIRFSFPVSLAHARYPHHSPLSGDADSRVCEVVVVVGGSGGANEKNSRFLENRRGSWMDDLTRRRRRWDGMEKERSCHLVSGLL